MTSITQMIDALNAENFEEARSALKATLSDYLAGKRYVSNKDIFGKDYVNPNEEEAKLKAELEA
jgi:hypothetical protein